jgi:N-carbamoyl-L-amino-acid hydrolase
MSTPQDLRIDCARLLGRIEQLAAVGAIDGGGVCRLALSEEDRAGRDLVCAWMRELGLAVSVDRIGNVVGVRAGAGDGLPVMMGSHIDTVRTGGRYDGNLGVLAGLEVIQCVAAAGLVTRRPLAVGFFTNEEGARFAPDMMGSLVHQGQLVLEQMLAVRGIDGATVGESLAHIGYAGEAPVGTMRAHAFLELHVEQGPVLEREGVMIGAVEGVQGISWTEITIGGVSNHAGTTPMRLRHDAGYAAASIATFVRELATRMGGDQVATVGALTLAPNLVNVIANRALLTVDLRNTDEARLREAEHALHAHLDALRAAEEVAIDTRSLARFEPVCFDPVVIAAVERAAMALGHSVRRMPSGAGHDAQAFAPNCPTGMVFVPSVGGVSHNVREYTEPAHIEAGANVLLRVVLELADQA